MSPFPFPRALKRPVFAAIAAFWVASLVAPAAARATCGDYLDSGRRHELVTPAQHPTGHQAPLQSPCHGPHCRSNSKIPVAPAPLVQVVGEHWAVPSADAILNIERARPAALAIALVHAQTGPEPLLDPPRC